MIENTIAKLIYYLFIFRISTSLSSIDFIEFRELLSSLCTTVSPKPITMEEFNKILIGPAEIIKGILMM